MQPAKDPLRSSVYLPPLEIEVDCCPKHPPPLRLSMTSPSVCGITGMGDRRRSVHWWTPSLALITKTKPFVLLCRHPPTHPHFQLIGSCCGTVLCMDCFGNMEPSCYGIASLPNFPCFCVFVSLTPLSSIHQPDGLPWTISPLLRIKARVPPPPQSFSLYESWHPSCYPFFLVLSNERRGNHGEDDALIGSEMDHQNFGQPLPPMNQSFSQTSRALNTLVLNLWHSVLSYVAHSCPSLWK